MTITLEDVTPSDLPAILKLNQSEVPHVGHLTAEKLDRISREAFYFRKAVDENGILAGFVLGFSERANYESENFLWFKARYQNFFYLDRVAVSKDFRGKGVGRKLYKDVENFSRSRNLKSVTLEVNIKPPNPDSILYHAALQYSPCGEQETEGGTKSVRMFMKEI